MKPKSALAIAIIVPAVFCGGAIAATKDTTTTAPTSTSTTVARKSAPAKTTATNDAKTPEVSATLDRTSYSSGVTMTLTVTDNIWAKQSLKVTDSSGTAWTKKSATETVTKFTAKASKNGTITVVLTRTWDKAQATAKVSYTVTTTAPTEPAPTPPPPTTEPTPPPPDPEPAPGPSATWAGYTPGKFYLGMSCGVLCPEKESALGQSYGVHRTYKQWNNWSGVANEIQADHAAGRLPWVSFKPPLAGAAGWSAVASGDYDADLRSLATTLKANDDKPVLITFHHEPSNDGTEDEGKLWAAAYVHIHDLLKAEGALVNVSDPPILQDWIFNPTNKTQDPINWATDAVLERAPFMGIDMYQNSTGEGYSVRIPRIIDWMAARGFPNKMVGIGETGSTATFSNVTADKWLNDSLTWAANNTDKVGVVSYFNSTANSEADVYWPLDESAAKMAVYKGWLNNSTTID